MRALKPWLLGGVGVLVPLAVGAIGLDPASGPRLPPSGQQVAVLTTTDRTFWVSIANFHPEFEFYRMTSADDAGICATLASTRAYSHDDYGGVVKTAFSLVRAQLTAVYGAANEFTDTVRPGSYWQAPHEWVHALYLKDRVYRAEWHAPAGHTFGGNITHIVLAVQAVEDARAFMTLLYQFDDPQCRGVDPRTEPSRPTAR